MLSRVAEALYWTARYVERAEDVARIVDAGFHSLLDAQVGDQAEEWRRIVALLGQEPAYLEHHDVFDADHVCDFLLWHPDNASAVVNCVALARENARSVREQLSSEQWQAVNDLFLRIRGTSRQSSARAPHALFQIVRDGAHRFQGATSSTMIHDEGREFIRLGLHLERGDATTRLAHVSLPAAFALPPDSAERFAELMRLLRSCSAFEAYVKRRGADVEVVPVAEHLLLSQEFPRSVAHCVGVSLTALRHIGGDEQRAERVLGRIAAELAYADAWDFLPGGRNSLREVLAGLVAAGDAITRSFFASQALLPGAVHLQEAQQQQCG